MPDFSYEEALGFPCLAGVDEVGRGPWAGPVVAAAVILVREKIPQNLYAFIDDSKKLSSPKRKFIVDRLIALDQAVIWAIGEASVQEIDAINILQATFLAMQRAVQRLTPQPQGVLVDGHQAPTFSCPTVCVIKGDQKSFSIAVASLFAKVWRDRSMARLALEYPAFKWDKNAGYGTAEHQKALEKYGVTRHHRKSYAPIAKFLI